MRKTLLFIMLFMLSSCSVLDYPKRIAGYSIQKFENEEAGRFEKSFEISKKQCYDSTLKIIKELRARVTHKSFNRGFIVAFDFSKSFDYCLDSTEAAFFIKETGDKSVTVTVICNNSMLAKLLSDKFFEMLSQ